MTPRGEISNAKRSSISTQDIHEHKSHSDGPKLQRLAKNRLGRLPNRPKKRKTTGGETKEERQSEFDVKFEQNGVE